VTGEKRGVVFPDMPNFRGANQGYYDVPADLRQNAFRTDARYANVWQAGISDRRTSISIVFGRLRERLPPR
jgi:hypothetical protein